MLRRHIPVADEFGDFAFAVELAIVVEYGQPALFHEVRVFSGFEVERSLGDATVVLDELGLSVKIG